MAECLDKKKYLTIDWAEHNVQQNAHLEYWLQSGDAWKLSYKLIQSMLIL